LAILILIKAGGGERHNSRAMWNDIETAPFDRDLELAVIDNGVHALVFPCVRMSDGWHHAVTLKPVDVTPTHWRQWPETFYFSCCG
jgi:hypothetical protein